MVSPETYQTADRKLIGSMMVFEAESLEVVRKAIEEDIYYTARVVRPLRSTIRIACSWLP